MPLNTYHFWMNGKVESVVLETADALPTMYENVQCVDPNFKDAHRRYGAFSQGGWQPMNPAFFDPEFKVHLLLLGVS